MERPTCHHDLELLEILEVTFIGQNNSDSQNLKQVYIIMGGFLPYVSNPYFHFHFSQEYSLLYKTMFEYINVV
jgi:hypothetical protein